eukprot:gene663-1281_t
MSVKPDINSGVFLQSHWDRYCDKLVDIFFKRTCLIDLVGNELLEFEKFLHVYWERASLSESSNRGQSKQVCLIKTEDIDLPTESSYSPRYLLSFAVVPESKDRDEKEFLNLPEIKDFSRIVCLWLDYKMKSQFNKMQKIIKSREDLPIFQYKNDILKAIQNNQICLIAGDTGCGKSTQTVQYLLSSGYNMIACTQPRRISCMSLCRRVSYETLNEYGDDIAYQIRFDSSRSKRSRVIFLTEGLLLRQITTNDPLLSQYSCVIVDEVHERHLTCDLLLGLLKAIVLSGKRPDLKVILMSATINITTFMEFFEGQAALVKVPGRMYPVNLEYVPSPRGDMTDMDRNTLQNLTSLVPGEGLSVDVLIQRRMRARRSKGQLDTSPYPRILQNIDKRYSQEERGDVLVFLSGMAEMTAVAEACRPYVEENKRWVVLYLHSSLSSQQQDQVFAPAPSGLRKCILSTNISETAVTIDGIRFVVDSGKSKEIRWDPFTGAKSLKEYWISRASAEQRKGRAGRTGPGVCFRLYSQDTYSSLVPFEEPEVVRTDLAAAVLLMKTMGLNDPRKFPFITIPPIEHISGAVLLLHVLGATISTITSLEEETTEGNNDKLKSSNVVVDSEGEEKTDLINPCQSKGGDAIPSPTLSLTDKLYDSKLTDMGYLLSRMPIDPAHARLLIFGSALHLWSQSVTVAAALGTPSPFLASRGQETGEELFRRRRFDCPDGDVFTVCEIFVEWSEQRKRSGAAKKWCKRHFIMEQRLIEMAKLRGQLWRIMASEGLLMNVPDQLKENIRNPNKHLRNMSYKEMKQLKFACSNDSSRKELSTTDSVFYTSHQTGGNENGNDHIDKGDEDVENDIEDPLTTPSDILDSLYLAKCFESLSPSESWRMRPQQREMLRLCLGSCLCPNVCIEDPSNSMRPQIERQFQSATRDGLVLLPGSVAYDPNRNIQSEGSSSRGSLHVMVEPKFYHFTGILETSKPFVQGVVLSPMLSSALILAKRIEMYGKRNEFIRIDGWMEIKILLKEDTDNDNNDSALTILNTVLTHAMCVRGCIDSLVSSTCKTLTQLRTSDDSDSTSTSTSKYYDKISLNTTETDVASLPLLPVTLSESVSALNQNRVRTTSELGMLLQGAYNNGCIYAKKLDDTHICQLGELFHSLNGLGNGSDCRLSYTYKKLYSLKPEDSFLLYNIIEKDIILQDGINPMPFLILWNKQPPHITTTSNVSKIYLGDPTKDMATEHNATDITTTISEHVVVPSVKRRRLGTSIKGPSESLIANHLELAPGGREFDLLVIKKLT